ncbi:MAG TPA: uracil phosphoribosyltransferase [Candidatus Eremiobacteraeota bacterium]|nr:MAG: Uracil phosphoribosyltransferase [bacterium ADurb.Bin363]HPZ09669.1 uracil phosphoribosyltransferase [Candidatus Eremiobacteraeota bacterium]
MSVNVITHPLVQHKLTLMRDKNTGPKDFRELLTEITILMFFEATKDLPLKEINIETPLKAMKSKVLEGKKLCIIPILRAGLGMAEAVLTIMPYVKFGHLGIYRNEETFKPVEYYVNIPYDLEERIVIIVDPMLATGGSAAYAVNLLKDKGAKKIKFLGLVAAPKGIDILQKTDPYVDIYIASIDESLNEKAYILPGLGDAGDRFYGTL